MIKQIYVFGTIATINFDSDNELEIMNKIQDVLNNMDDEMSVYKEYSNISKINRLAGKECVKVSKDFLDIVKKSLYYSRLTDGNLDITSKPIIDIVKSGNLEIEKIEEQLKYIDYNKVIVDEKNSTIKLKEEGMQIDLGSMVKGYATDLIVKILNENKVKSAVIDLGGNVYVKGYKNENNRWNVGIQDPYENRYTTLGYLKLNDKSVVTSGNYERVGHIISPKIGILDNHNISSVTIISEKSIDGEGLSTGLYVLGLEKGMKLIKTLSNIDAIFITEDKKIYCSENIKDKFILTNSDYTVMEVNTFE